MRINEPTPKYIDLFFHFICLNHKEAPKTNNDIKITTERIRKITSKNAGTLAWTAPSILSPHL